MGTRESAVARYRRKVDHAREVDCVLQWLGWSVAVLATISLVAGQQGSQSAGP